MPTNEDINNGSEAHNGDWLKRRHNPFAEKFVPQGSGMAEASNTSEMFQLAEKVQKLQQQVDDLTLYMKSVFDGHVLINGQFVKITP